MQLNHAKVEEYFAYLRERYRVFLQKENGNPPPWTKDPIISNYRFCNVFREDDKVTRWYAKHIREPMVAQVKGGDLVFATIVFRLFNRIETTERLLKAGVFCDWDKNKAKRAVKDLSPVVSPAYIIIGRPGFNKADGIIEILDDIYGFRFDLYEYIHKHKSIEAACLEISKFERMGMFLAYEVACDLRYSPVLADATDKLTWANPGPGAARGLSRMIGEDKGYFNRNSPRDRDTMMRLMQELLKKANEDKLWPKRWPRWEMREVEHGLCEFDKYLRAKTGEGRPKQRYVAGG